MTKWVTRLIIVNVVMFVLTSLRPAMTSALMLVPVLVPIRPWTIVTYMFLHGGLWHLLFNMLGLFFFGPRLEVELGGRRFLWLYFVSGIMGAVLSVLTPFTAIIGASGAVFGVFLGFAYFWPREQIYVWGIVPVEARLLVVIMTALSLFGGFSGDGGGIAHLAHLGGFVGGFLYLKGLERFSRAARFRAKLEVPNPRLRDVQRWAKIRRENLHEVNREELDRILEKIKSTGVENLTQGEKEFLDRFSSE
jgi:membrane associated rhomboid family serine protease